MKTMTRLAVAVGSALLVAGPLPPPSAAAQDAGSLDNVSATLEQYDYKGAITQLDSIKSSTPKEELWRWWLLRGEAFFGYSKDADALKACNESIKLNPESRARRIRARVHHRYNRIEQALADLDKAPSILKHEEGGAVHPLREAIRGPYAARWPLASKKLSVMSRSGKFRIESAYKHTPAQLDALERQLAAATPAERKDLLKPQKLLPHLAAMMDVAEQTVTKTCMLPKRWPKGRVVHVVMHETTAQYQQWWRQLGEEPPKQSQPSHDKRHDIMKITLEWGGEITWIKIPKGNMRCLLHHLFSQLWSVHYGESLPLWVETSTGLFLRQASIEVTVKGKVTIKTGEIWKVLNRGTSNYQHALNGAIDGRPIPWTELFHTTRRKWKGLWDDPKVIAEGWGAMYFLYRGKNSTFTGAWKKWQKALLKGEQADDAFKREFPDAKLAKIEAAWGKFLQRQ